MVVERLAREHRRELHDTGPVVGRVVLAGAELDRLVAYSRHLPSFLVRPIRRPRATSDETAVGRAVPHPIGMMSGAGVSDCIAVDDRPRALAVRHDEHLP